MEKILHLENFKIYLSKDYLYWKQTKNYNLIILN